MDFYCNSFDEYMKYMKEIESPFLSTVLKKIVLEFDICSILNEKENEGIEKQKTIIEPKQRNIAAKYKKGKRTRDEEYTKKLNGRKQPQNGSHEKNKQPLNISR